MKKPRHSCSRMASQRLVFTFFCISMVLLLFSVLLRGLNWTHSHYATGDIGSTGLLLASACALMCLFYLVLFVTRSAYHYAFVNAPSRSQGVKRVGHWPLFILVLGLPLVLLAFVSPKICLALCGGLLFLGLLFLLSRPKDYSPEVVRGTKVISIRQAYRIIRRLSDPRERFLLWAGFPFPERYATQHFGIIGTIGEGKSVTEKILLKSLLPDIVPGSDWRCIVFDIKGDMAGFLRDNALCPVHVLNPFLKDSVAWHLARDFKSPASCLQVATGLVQDEKMNPFFSNSARGLLAATLIAYTISKPDKWTLAEVLYTLSNRQATEALLNSVPQTRHYAKRLANNDEKTSSNIFSTVHSNAEALSPVANLMARSEDKISLNHWLEKEESILVLSFKESLRSPTLAIYSVLFQRLSELILSLPESDTRRIYLFNDELAACGYWPSLCRLMWGGRSKGFRAFLAWQTMEGLRTVYKKEADDIAGLTASKLLLRTDSVETAEYYSKVIGDVEIRQWTRSERSGTSQSPPSFNECIVTKRAVLPSQFMHMPRADRERFFGYYVTPDVGCFHGPVYFSHLLPEKGDNQSEEPEARSVEEQYLPEHLIVQGLHEKPLPSLDEFKRITIDDETDREIMKLLEEPEED